MEKAMKPSATSLKMENFSINSSFITPMPTMGVCQFAVFSAMSSPSLPKTNGPMRIPATRYAVTAGNFKIFAKRERSNPASRDIDNTNNLSIQYPFSKEFFFNRKTLYYLCARKANERGEKNEKIVKIFFTEIFGKACFSR